MRTRHSWRDTESQWSGQAVQRCAVCATERTRDAMTATLYLYRRGLAQTAKSGPLGEEWRAFKFGVVPRCVAPAAKEAS